MLPATSSRPRSAPVSHQRHGRRTSPGDHCGGKQRRAARGTRLMCSGRPVGIVELRAMLEALRQAAGDVAALRAGLAALLAATASTQVCRVFVSLGGSAQIAISAGTAPDDHVVQVYALRLIRATAAASEFAAADVDQYSAIAGLAVAVAGRFKDQATQQAACELLTALMRRGGTAVVAQAGAGDAVAEALRLHIKNSRVLQSALEALCLLSEVGGLPGQAIGALLQAMRVHGRDAGLQAAACVMMLDFVGADSGRAAKAVSLGAFEVVLAATECHAGNMEVQLHACRLLAALVQGAKHGCASSCPSIAVVDAAAAILKAWPNYAVEEKARVALQDSFAVIADTYPVQAVLAVRRCCVAWADTGLQASAQQHGEHCQPFMWIVAMRLARHSSEVQRLGCEMLVKLAEAPPGEIPGGSCKAGGIGCSSIFAKRLVEAGAMNAAIDAMGSFVADAGTQRAACEAIVALILAAGPEVAAARALSGGALGAAAATLRTLGVIPWLSHVALDVIAAVLSGCATDAARTAAEEAGCWEAAATALRQHPRCHRVVDSANAVLSLFAPQRADVSLETTALDRRARSACGPTSCRGGFSGAGYAELHSRRSAMTPRRQVAARNFVH